MTSYDDDHDGLVTAALRERSRDGEPPMALTAGGVLVAARRRARYRRVLGAAAAVTMLAAGGGLAAQLTHHGSGHDQLAAGGTPTSSAALPPPSGMPKGIFDLNGMKRKGGLNRKPMPAERAVIERYQAALNARLPGLAHGLTPVPGNYFGTGTVQPYSYALEGDEMEDFKVWLRSGGRTGSVSVVIAGWNFGVPTDCDQPASSGGMTCTANTSAGGNRVVTITDTGPGAPSVLVYLTKPDGTRMFLISSANTEDGKFPDHTSGALTHLPVSAADLVTLADDPAFTARYP
ncbi:MAG: hypothetical protein ACJ73S_23970 [Mycobacteriales bacterium]